MKKFIPILLSCLSLSSCHPLLPRGLGGDVKQPYYIDYKDSNCSLSNVSIELYLALWNCPSTSDYSNPLVSKIIYLNLSKNNEYNLEYNNNSIILKEIPLEDISKNDYCFYEELTWGGLLTSDWYMKIKYTSTIFVTIPIEIFSKNEGYFTIAFTSKDLEDNRVLGGGDGVLLKYTKSNDKVSIKRS